MINSNFTALSGILCFRLDFLYVIKDDFFPPNLLLYHMAIWLFAVIELIKCFHCFVFTVLWRNSSDFIFRSRIVSYCK